MLNNLASFVLNCRPLTIVASDSNDGFRVGGNPPAGVSPRVVNEYTRYFGTIPLGGPLGGPPSLELSLFTSFADDDYTDPAWQDTSACMLLSEDSPLVQFVIHEHAPRSEHSSLEAEFPGHALRLEAEWQDNPKKESNRMWIHHKIGGFPFFYHERPAIIADTDLLLANGYTHLLQMASPGFEDVLPNGEWAFGNYMFHVFLKETEQGLTFRYTWA